MTVNTPDSGVEPPDTDVAQPRKRLGCAWGLLIAAVAVAVFVVLWPSVVLPPVARFLDVTEPLQRTDAVLILGGDEARRPHFAAAVYRAGLTDKVIVTRPKLFADNLHGVRPSSADLTCDALRLEGVPDEDILVFAGEVDSTLDELHQLKDYMQEHAEHRVAILTTAYHTRRTRMLAHRVLGDAAQRIRMIGTPAEEFSDDNWWKSKVGFMTHLREYSKLIFHCRNQIAIAVAALVLLDLVVVYLRRRRARRAYRRRQSIECQHTTSPPA